MLGGVTRHMLPHLSGVPHLHINRPQNKLISLKKLLYLLFIYSSSRQKKGNHCRQNLHLHNKIGQHLIVPKEKNTPNNQIYKLACLVPRFQIFCLEMTAPWIGHGMRAELGYVYWNKIFRVGLGKPYRNLATQRPRSRVRDSTTSFVVHWHH